VTFSGAGVASLAQGLTFPGMAKLNRIENCLWFDDQAEEAAKLYTGIFPSSSIGQIARYSEVGQEIHGKRPGSVMTVEFTLDGTKFMALNGGPDFKFNEAVSFMILCNTQEEIDHYWDKLGAGGDPKAQQCGWLKDKFGVSWQVVPAVMAELSGDGQSEASKRVMAATFEMKKLDIAALQRAYRGS
jgi:predicted 3-demethylubiquinone-9 3-methyltransferase (glyoxalase superfamily)